MNGRKLLWIAIGIAGLTVMGRYTAKPLMAQIKAVFVEVGLPGRPFFGEITLGNNDPKSAGPDTGTLGITSLTITNSDTKENRIFLFRPGISGGDCRTGTVISIVVPDLFEVFVQPHQTTHLSFPSPVVIPNYNDHTCITAEATTSPNSVSIYVNGFVN
jgi:hypothetical protein